MTNAMTLQRQYSLPNCTLILEGLSDPTATGQADIRPVMSLLINAECHLPGQETPLKGGREFFESLVTAVSLYAQEFLSGVHLPRHTYSDRPSFVTLERLDRSHHRLSVGKDPNNPASEERSADLTTVQLFDLVEAIDQFVADTQTLPFWSLNLSPVPKRYARSGEPLAKQVVPASIGVSGLALAAVAFFSLPTMRVKTPECLSPGAPDCPAAIAKNSPSPSPSPSISPSPTPSPTAAASPDLTQLETALNAAPAITDVAELKTLGDRVTEQIRGKWTTQPAVTEELAYRIGVARNGDIVGFKAETPVALEKARQQTPLLDLLYLPPGGSTPNSEPLAQYRVVFKPQGNLEVTPANAASAVPSATVAASPSPDATVTASPSPTATVAASPSPTAAATPATELTDAETLENLQPKLYDAIDKSWQGRPPFDKDLVYRVRIKPDGTIVGFQPDNPPANEFVKSTPLPQLSKQIDPNAPAESAASFKVVFKPSGVLQINPWYGVVRKK
ncbi:MAG: DUF4335 domain-containing protein [Leptolyngbya sp. UWPOB_LEPTO1]|uniref:DUF4335 domain-containing protein n=1 Tax=Leptolyngbya sp. UWPOB_LEPTO1 TaxID=2815653 RepID=UPI001AC5E818|nr:DUF4335 domain-containing protein [Leptolyngbya sp. UWPOB_LEPTO1]MBN8561695.1 DUF4335 domain-containing protein [Leptolyngbya sp. UWPOB_LEPTO1]